MTIPPTRGNTAAPQRGGKAPGRYPLAKEKLDSKRELGKENLGPLEPRGGHRLLCPGEGKVALFKKKNKKNVRKKTAYLEMGAVERKEESATPGKVLGCPPGANQNMEPGERRLAARMGSGLGKETRLQKSGGESVAER